MPHRASVTNPRVLRELLAEAGELRLAVTGGSMRPALRAGDTVVVRPLAGRPRLGDVVVFVRGGQLWCHRVLLAGRRVLTKGDARGRPDAPVAPEDLVGLAVAIQRGRRILDLGGLRAKLAGLAVSLAAPAAALGRRIAGGVLARRPADRRRVRLAGFAVELAGAPELLALLPGGRVHAAGPVDFSLAVASRLAATGGGRYGLVASGGGRFTLVTPVLAAHFNLRRRSGRAELVAGFEPDALAVVLRMLGMLLVSHLDGGLALHASAVRRGGRAYLFTGEAGAGKSTALRLAAQAGAQPLADDLVLLRPDGAGRWLAWGPLLEPEVERPPAGSGRGTLLAALIAPARGDFLEVERLSGARWLALSASFTPGAPGADQLLGRLGALAESVPAWRVRFPKRRGALEGLFRALERPDAVGGD